MPVNKFCLVLKKESKLVKKVRLLECGVIKKINHLLQNLYQHYSNEVGYIYRFKHRITK